jgi:hypothetical protein
MAGALSNQLIIILHPGFQLGHPDRGSIFKLGCAPGLEIITIGRGGGLGDVVCHRWIILG